MAVLKRKSEVVDLTVTNEEDEDIINLTCYRWDDEPMVPLPADRHQREIIERDLDRMNLLHQQAYDKPIRLLAWRFQVFHGVLGNHNPNMVTIEVLPDASGNSILYRTHYIPQTNGTMGCMDIMYDANWRFISKIK